MKSSLTTNTWYITDRVKKEYALKDYRQIYALLQLKPSQATWKLFNKSMGEYVVYNAALKDPKLFNRDATFQTQIDIFGPCVITTLNEP